MTPETPLSEKIREEFDYRYENEKYNLHDILQRLIMLDVSEYLGADTNIQKGGAVCDNCGHERKEHYGFRKSCHYSTTLENGDIKLCLDCKHFKPKKSGGMVGE